MAKSLKPLTREHCMLLGLDYLPDARPVTVLTEEQVAAGEAEVYKICARIEGDEAIIQTFPMTEVTGKFSIVEKDIIGKIRRHEYDATKCPLGADDYSQVRIPASQLSRVRVLYGDEATPNKLFLDGRLPECDWDLYGGGPVELC